MPLTYSDLIRWEAEKDIDKFHQILLFMIEDEYKSLISYAVMVLERVHNIDSLQKLIEINKRKISEELSEQIKNVIVNWGEPAIELLQDHVKKSNTKYSAKQALLTMGEIEDDRVISFLIEIIYENFRSFEVEACNILQKKLKFQKLIDLYKNNDAKIRYAIVKVATSYPHFEDYTNSLVNESSKLKQPVSESIDVDNCSEIDGESQTEIGITNDQENIYSTELGEIYKFFELVVKDENVIVRYAGISGLFEEMENAKSGKKDRNEKEVFPFVRNLLLLFLTDEDFYIRQIAIKHLSHFNTDEHVYNKLKSIFEKREILLLEQVLLTLGDFKKEELIEEFATICYDQKQEESIRLAAVKALRQMPNDRTKQILMNIIESENDTFLQFETIKSLEFYNPKDTFDFLLPLFDHERTNVKMATVTCVVSQNDPIWENPILSFLDKNDEFDFVYPLTRYLKTFQDNRAKLILIKKIVNSRYSREIEEYFWVLKTILGEKSVEELLIEISLTDDIQIQDDLDKFKTILANRK